MSAGKFDLNGKYESDGGQVYRCKPQPESKALSLASSPNAYPAGALTAGVGSIELRKSRRSLGVVPRSVVVRWTADGSGAQADYEGEGASFTVPVFDPSVWAGYNVGDVGTYLGVACVLDFKNPELTR